MSSTRTPAVPTVVHQVAGGVANASATGRSSSSAAARIAARAVAGAAAELAGVDAADALRVVLELAGHQTEVAYNGPDGLQRARAFALDVVFCDIGMDGMNGHEVARTLRADPELGRVALVAVTGYGASEDMAKARAAGFDLHVTKPLGRDRLEQVLAALEAARPSHA